MSIAPGSLGFQQLNSSPATPPAGFCIIYSKTDNVLYLKDSSGVEVALGSASAITSLTGEATGTGPGATSVTLSNSAVIGKVLTGFSSGPNSIVLSTDTLLQAIQKLQAQITASSGSAITVLTGDVSAAGPGSAAATVNSIGGSSAANVHSAELAANAATAANTASTIVKRDASGNFSANIITASLSGNATTATTSTNFSGSLSGDVTGTQSSTVVATVGGKSAAAVSTSVDDTTAATSSNTASTIVKRNASGNFSAGTITASLTGNVSGTSSNITGIAAIANGGTNSSAALSNNRVMKSSAGAIIEAAAITGHRALASDANGIPTHSITTDTELGYVSGVTSSIQTQIDSVTGSGVTSLTGDVTGTGPGATATTVVTVGTSSATNIHTAELAANAATSSNTASTIVKRDSSGNFIAGTITANLTGNVTGNVTGSASNNVLKAGDTMTGELFITAAGTGLNVSNDIVAGGNVLATGTVTGSNLSGTNTGDVTITDTNSIDLTLVGQALSAVLKLSADAADAGNIKATSTIHSDGLHVEVPFDTPSQIGTSNFAGSGPSVAAANHVHAHGNQTSGTLHAAVTSSVNGFMISTDKNKLDASTDVNTASTIVMRDSSGNTNLSSVDLANYLTLDQTSAPTAPSGKVRVFNNLSNGFDRTRWIDSTGLIVTLNRDNYNVTYNNTGSSISKGQLVYINGQNSGAPTVALAKADVMSTANVYGFAMEIIPAASYGRVQYSGVISNVDTSAITAGSLIYLSDTSAGTFISTPPSIPNLKVIVGTVTTSSVSGVIAITIETAIELGTNLNTANAVVKRDGSGNFSAGTITANLTGNASGSSASFTGSLVGDVTGTQGATVVSTVGGKTASAIASSVNDTIAATASNTASTIVKRDGSGNFSAGTITANLTGNASGTAANVTGIVALANGGTNASTAATARVSLNIDERSTFSNAPYTVLNTDRYVAQIGTMSATRIVTLPTASSVNAGQTITIADESGTVTTTNLLTITPAGADTINGSATKTIRSAYGYIHLYSNGTNQWFAGVEGIGRGGTGLSSLPTDGQLLIGSSTNSNYALASLTAGTGIAITNASGSITVTANQISPTVTKTANYTILSTDSIIFVDTTSGAFTLTLPDPSTLAGKIFRIIGTSGTMSANNLTLARFGSEKIEGLATSKLLQTNWGGFNVTTNGTDWFLF